MSRQRYHPSSHPNDPPGLDADEHALLTRLRAGDDTAFDTLFAAFYGDLVIFASALVGNDAVGEELVCEVFGYLWTTRDRLQIHDTIRGYLYTAVRNRAMRSLRRDASEDRYLSIEWPAVQAQAEQEEQGSDAGLLAAEQRAAIVHVLNTLSPRVREALMLRYEHGLKYAEIAAVMGLSVKTVELHLARAFRELRERLAGFR